MEEEKQEEPVAGQESVKSESNADIVDADDNKIKDEEVASEGEENGEINS